MFPFRERRRKATFHRPQSDAFRLDTGDVEESRGFWRRLLGGHDGGRSVFSRYIVAGGARDTRQEGEAATEARSWRRFSWALTLLILLWLLGYFL